MHSTSEELQKIILELNYLGCSITEEDKFKPFECNWRTTIEGIKQPGSYSLQLDLNKIIDLLAQSILKHIEGKRPVVLLSGGIDSTLIAAILAKQKISFECFSYVLGKDDPTLENVRYVEQQLKIKSQIIYYDRARIGSIWNNYFDYYDSPTMDYATLIMADFIRQIQNKLNDSHAVLLDGTGADGLFGFKGLTNKSLYRSHILNFFSRFNVNYNSYNRKVNIYALPVVKNLYSVALFQNYIFSRVSNLESRKIAKAYVNSLLPSLHHSVNSFYIGHALMALFYDDRRYIYKNNGLKGNKLPVAFPYLDKNVVNYGLSIANKLKVNPTIKQPLRSALIYLGFQKNFVYRPKLGFIFDIFEIINIDNIIEQMSLLSKHFQLSRDYQDFLVREYQERNSAVDHFLFGLAMSQKWLQHH